MTDDSAQPTHFAALFAPCKDGHSSPTGIASIRPTTARSNERQQRPFLPPHCHTIPQPAASDPTAAPSLGLASLKVERRASPSSSRTRRGLRTVDSSELGQLVDLSICIPLLSWPALALPQHRQAPPPAHNHAETPKMRWCDPSGSISTRSPERPTTAYLHHLQVADGEILALLCTRLVPQRLEATFADPSSCESSESFSCSSSVPSSTSPSICVTYAPGSLAMMGEGASTSAWGSKGPLRSRASSRALVMGVLPCPANRSLEARPCPSSRRSRLQSANSSGS